MAGLIDLMKQKIGAKIEERNQFKAEEMESAYSGLKGAIDEYKAGLPDVGGQHLAEHLQTFGVLPKGAKWERDDVADKEIVKRLDAGIKLFEKGTYTADDFYKSLGNTIQMSANGSFNKKLSKPQQEGLSKAQASSKEGLASQYISTLSTPEDIPIGASQRLGMLDLANAGTAAKIGHMANVNPEVLTDPSYAQYQPDIATNISKESPGLLTAMTNSQFAQDSPALASKFVPALAKQEAPKEFQNKTAIIDVDGTPHNALIDNQGNTVKVLGKVTKTKANDASHVVSTSPDSPTGLRYFYLNPETGRHDIPGIPAPKNSIGASERSNIRFDNLVKAADSETITKPYRTMFNTAPRIERAKQEFDKTGNAAMLDDALLYTINKMNDPTSVVMIGEYMRTKELQSWWNNIKGNIGKLNKDNAGLTPVFRDQVYRAVMGAVKDKTTAYNNRMKYYRSRASKYNDDSAEVKSAFPLSNEIMKEEEGPSLSTGKAMTFNPTTGRIE